MPYVLFHQYRSGWSLTDRDVRQVIQPAGIPESAWIRLTGSDWLLLVAPPASYLDPGSGRQRATTEYPAWPLVAFDGLLSNAESLVGQLQPDQRAGMSAPELIACLYRARGAEALDGLSGNFSACLVDPSTGDVHVRRDRLGGRGLYLRTSGNIRALATNSASLARFRTDRMEENPAFITSRFSPGCEPESGQSAFLDVEEILPGQRLSLTTDGEERARHPLPTGGPPTGRSTEQWVEHFHELLQASVRANLGADGPVAAMLSGGMDSGPMVATASHPMTRAGRKLIPVSWMLPENPAADESRWIERLCRYLDLPLESFDADSMQPFDSLDIDMISPDLPAYNAFRPLVNHCYRTAAELGCKIILNGNAGDMLYPPYRLLLIDQWRRYGPAGIGRSLGEMIRYGGLRSLASNAAIRHSIGRQIPFRQRRTAGPPCLTPWARAHATGPRESWPPETADHPLPDYARQLLGRPMNFGRAQENNNAHRFGIERRDPFHDEALVGLMLQAPFNLSYRDGYSKWIMRQAMVGRMPESLRTKPRTGRMGSFFEAGFNKNRSRIHDLLFSRNRSWQRYIKPGFVEKALKPGTSRVSDRLLVNQCIAYVLWREYWEGL